MPADDGARGVGDQPRGGEERLGLRLRVYAERIEQARRDAGLLGQLALVQREAGLEDVLRPRGLVARRRQPAAGGDPDQRLLREPELLHLVPAAEAEAGVPVQVAAVGPVAGQHARHPAPQQRLVVGRQRRHPAGDGRVVEPVGRRHDVRVLGRLGVQLRSRRPVGEVVEAHARAERARGARRGAADRAHEAPQLPVHVAVQEREIARDLGGGAVDLRVPVDLVQPDRRIAPVRPAARPAAGDPGSARRCSGRARSRRAPATPPRARRRPRRRRPGAGRCAPRASTPSSPARAAGCPAAGRARSPATAASASRAASRCCAPARPAATGRDSRAAPPSRGPAACSRSSSSRPRSSAGCSGRAPCSRSRRPAPARGRLNAQ